MIVVELRTTDTDRDVEIPDVAWTPFVDCAECSAHYLAFFLGNRVRHEIGRWIALLFQDREIALKFVAQYVQERSRRRCGRQGEAEEKNRNAHKPLG